jgi:hypothetical protein
VLSPSDNILTFNILSSFNIKAFVVLDVLDVLISVFKCLPPIAVGAPDLHVLVFA